MSFLDRQRGEIDGSAATARQYNSAINKWEAHANQLNGRLQNANENAEALAKLRLLEQAQNVGLKALVQALKDELARACPSSPLLRDAGIRKNISGEAMVQFFRANGYHYDKQSECATKMAP